MTTDPRPLDTSKLGPIRLEQQPLVWWTNEHDCRLIGAIAAGTQLRDGWSEGDGPPTWPLYIADSYGSRYGRAGRGRLWVSAALKETKIDPWPDTPIGRRLGESYGGVVIWRSDHCHVAALPGMVTDLSLKLISYRGEK